MSDDKALIRNACLLKRITMLQVLQVYFRKTFGTAGHSTALIRQLFLSKAFTDSKKHF